MKIKKVVVQLVFVSIAILIIYPLIFVLSNAFRPLKEAYQYMAQIVPTVFTTENFDYLFGNLPLLTITFNTFFIASVVTVIKLVVAFFAAYGFAYANFSGKKWLYLIVISTLFIPFTVSMIPNYLFMSQLNFIDTKWGVILPQLADAMGIFILTQTMRSIPKSLLDVAKIDNVKQSIILKHIILPLCRHAIVSTGIWFFITSWNEYVWPVLILKSVNKYTLPLAMQTYISAEGGTNFTVAMAISLVTMAVPLCLYIICQKYIIGTFVSSGIK